MGAIRGTQSAQAMKMKRLGYVSAMEAATLLGLHVANVYRLGTAGKLVTSRIGRSWYVKLSSLEAYLKGSNAPAELVAQIARLRTRLTAGDASRLSE